MPYYLVQGTYTAEGAAGGCGVGGVGLGGAAGGGVGKEIGFPQLEQNLAVGSIFAPQNLQ